MCMHGTLFSHIYSYFDSSKKHVYNGGNDNLQLVCGGLAGSTAALFTTPFDVVKTRLQIQVNLSLDFIVISIICAGLF